MSETTISDLYEKYTNQVGEALEDDRYFQYLFEMVQAGDNTLQQKNRILHKVIDEKWLTVVEEGIEAIFNIVDKPRRFIATSEEVVPVALAKKITADSVRHLSQHTQFITENAAGEIQPTKILNVTTEESYDLYENRFVYHLIQRLFAFVDKRTDVIFWSTGDETCNVMSMESKVDDAYEEISYKVEMTIKNRQSYVENDTDHMDLFKRIDRVRRLSRTLRTSSFCDIMNGCAKVRSPIQRTNLMMKDPDYRTCYKLWQFIESYDEVGYTIEEQDSALQFDEEYLLQMYINFITNYTVFKSLLESDQRNVTELAKEKREPVKPKFVKEIKEEIVEDRNIPDVEIRQVFVEEVTQAQLDAEAKLEEETQRREELERSLSELEFQMDSLNQQMEFLEQTRMQMEQERAELEEQLRKEQKVRQETEAAMVAADIEARNAIETAQAEAKNAVEAAQTEAKNAVETAQAEARRSVEEAEIKAKESVEAAKAEARESIEKTEAEAKRSVENLQKVLDTVRREKERELTAALDRAEKAEKDAKNSRKEKEKKQKAAAEEIDRIRKEATDAAARSKKESKAAVAAAQREAAKAVEEALRKQEEAEKEMHKALAKAESASLSHYIVKRLQERRESKNTKEDDRNS
ncbi:DUF2357 domain-containing protein [Blautia sp. MSJ-19]|uniref:DUF2357 domain-containing protein n=1 Tax=Blautia sp. MSJ-19 TaxID=2841517 RepID=UPI001C0F1BD7|nr:DUF2357 domain-containing protein [Blautia sp. MSJ-19]MBU5480522.1 hypothetical protein [Blautia sp. MSJ-19]